MSEKSRSSAEMSERHAAIEAAIALPADYIFDVSKVVSAEDVAALALMRATSPSEIDLALSQRRRRQRLTTSGKLVILAADHPARMVTAVGKNTVEMANRASYLGRIVHVLQNSPVDGLMATTDIIDEVAALCRLHVQRGGEDFLAERLLIGSMNRTGFQGARDELYDPPSSYLTADHLVQANLDGGKILWRYSAGASNRLCLQTFERMAEIAAQLAAAKLPLFIEPLAVTAEYDAAETSGQLGASDESGTTYRPRRGPRRWQLSTDLAEWMRVISAAAAMGPSTARNWIKIPYLRGGADDGLTFADVAGSTTLPILLLGGPSKGTVAPMLTDFSDGMQTSGNVLGALVGRNVLYPGNEDPALAARAVCHVVHDGLSPVEAAAVGGERVER